jgi:DNA polymerase-3 subunit gamma/tau
MLIPGNFDNISSFLKYLRQNNEMESYYELFNNLSIKSFAERKIEIASNVNIKFRDRIKKLLFAWTGQEWDVIICGESGIPTLKSMLEEELKSSHSWQIIKESFPGAEITDLLLKI